MSSRPILSLIAAIALFASACSSRGDDGPVLDDYAAAIAETIEASSDDVQVDGSEALCIGVAVAGEIGLERLRETGTPEEVAALTEDDLSAFDLSDAQAIEIADAYLSCIPEYVERFVEALDVGEARECVVDAIDVDDLRTPTASAIQGDEAADEEIAFLYEALGACEGTEDLEPYVEAIARSVHDDANEALGISTDEARCFAENLVAVVGADRLTAFGGPDELVETTAVNLSPLDLSMAELQTIASGYFDCSPTVASQFRVLFLEGTGLPDEQRACVDRLISDDILIDIIAASLGGLPPESAVDGLEAQFESCG